MRDWLPEDSVWRQRWLTLLAMAGLCLARFLVGFVPLKFWRKTLGSVSAGMDEGNASEAVEAAERLSRRVDRAAARLPFETKCLPRAMALSWLLRPADIGHDFVIAARPPGLRSDDDGLHAWIEVEGQKVIGDLPGPWHVVFRSIAWIESPPSV